MKTARRMYCSSFLKSPTFSHFSTAPQVRKLEDTSGKSTIDLRDISKYSKLTSNWWDVNGKMKLLHSMNSVRTKFITDGLATAGFEGANPHRPLEGVELLDVGCGGGILSEPLARMGARVTGIDVSTELLSVAKEHAALDAGLSSNLTYRSIAIEGLAEEKKDRYDVVVASEIIEHVDNQSLFVKSCTEVLKPKGSIFITTLNRNFISWLGAIVGLEYVLRQIPVGIHDWHKFITPDETKLLLEKCNCETKQVEGLFYNPAINKWSRTSFTAIFYALHAVKQGFSSD